MNNLIGFNCPECGGELRIREGIRNISCTYCGKKLVLTTPIGIERYYVKPTITNPKETARMFLGKTIILDVDMLFIPIIKLNTELIGWLYAYKKGTVEWLPGDNYEQPIKVVKGQERVRKRVNVMRETKLFPLQHLPAGEDRIPIENLQLYPYDDEKLHLYGNVMDPPESKDCYLKEGIQRLINNLINRYKDYDELTYKIEPVCPHLIVYYYPVVIVRFKGGILSLDGVRKRPLIRIGEEEEKKHTKAHIPLLTLLFSAVVSAVSLKDIKIAAAVFIILFCFLLAINYGD